MASSSQSTTIITDQGNDDNIPGPLGSRETIKLNYLNFTKNS